MNLSGSRSKTESLHGHKKRIHVRLVEMKKCFKTIVLLMAISAPCLLWGNESKDESNDTENVSVKYEDSSSFIKKDIGNGDIRTVEIIMDFETKADDSLVHHAVLNGASVPWFYDSGLDRIILSVSNTTDLLVGRKRPGIFKATDTEESPDGKKENYSLLYEFYLTDKNTLRIIAYRWRQ